MLKGFIDKVSQQVPRLLPMTRVEYAEWIEDQVPLIKEWISTLRFEADTGKFVFLPTAPGIKTQKPVVLAGIGDGSDPLALGALPPLLPQGEYQLHPDLAPARLTESLLAWGLGCYSFDRYKKSRRGGACLAWPAEVNNPEIVAILEAIYLTRDLINIPAEDMGPADIASQATELAKGHGAKIRIIEGDDLLRENFPAIHMVGRASSRPPLLIDLEWGNSGPRITLVGKGVCFDSGGLDIKPSSGMLLMKKDMGGAALVLGLGHAIMSLGLKVRLRILIPAVDNAISGNAYRPMDVVRTRKGISVEIGNTDAEGRVILCDALQVASEAKPDLIIDAATLTGAARVALGAELPALFSSHDDLADQLLKQGERLGDPLWRMPLFKPYRWMLDGKVADLTNSPESGYGGAITAALYLQEFVPGDTPWMHIDTMAWNVSARPGRPVGGEAFGLRALLGFIKNLTTENKILGGRPAPRKTPAVKKIYSRRHLGRR